MESSTGEPWFVVDNITLDPGARFAMTISGFPAEAAWRHWATGCSAQLSTLP